MRALVSSFLSVSAVLAGYHPEKQQQPPFRNRVKKSINSTTVWPIHESAGVAWVANPEETIAAAAATFTLPSNIMFVEDARLNMVVGISASGCETRSTIGAGISGLVHQNGVSYEVFGIWGPRRVISSWTVSPGDVIRVSIERIDFDPGEALVTLRNLNTNDVWSEFINGDPPESHCRQNVNWIVTSSLGAVSQVLPGFDKVIIKEMSFKVSGDEMVPRRPDIEVTDIESLGRVETCTLFYRDHAIIVYIPPPPPG